SAVKIAAGAGRARVPVTAAALTHAGVDPALLTAFAGETVLGGGRPVGGVRPVAGLGAAADAVCV
ncbi:asparaginase, partial [Streptomyces albogriseolus]